MAVSRENRRQRNERRKKMNVTLARALKEKNRIAGRLAKAQQLVRKENRKVAGSPRAVDVAAALAEAERLSALLVQVKAAIAKANDGIVGAIVELEEVKSLISFIESVPSDEDVEVDRDYHGAVERRWEVSLRKPDLMAKVDALQKRADALQDALDEYNATTRVDLPDIQ